jgi:hypothetical protein
MSQFLSKPETINPLATNSNWRNTVYSLQPCAYQGGSLSGTGGAIFSSWTLCVGGTSWSCICSTWSASSRGLSDNPHFDRSCVLYILLKESLSSALGKNCRLQMKWYSRLNNQWSAPNLTYCLLVLFLDCFVWLVQSSDETLHLVLETLQAAVKAGLYYHCDYCKLVHMYVFFYMLTCAPCGVPYFQ